MTGWSGPFLNWKTGAALIGLALVLYLFHAELGRIGAAVSDLAARTEELIGLLSPREEP